MEKKCCFLFWTKTFSFKCYEGDRVLLYTTFYYMFSAEVGTSFVPVNNGNVSFWESPCGNVYVRLIPPGSLRTSALSPDVLLSCPYTSSQIQSCLQQRIQVSVAQRGGWKRL